MTPEFSLSPEPNMFVSSWEQKLRQCVSESAALGDIHPEIAQEAQTGITNWVKDKEHGGVHAWYVYMGMQWLAKQEYIEPQPKTWEAAAALHDLGQFLPLKNRKTGESNLTGNPRLRHPQMLNVLTRLFGDRLGLTGAEVIEAASAIRIHDDVFANKIHPELSDTAKLLSDADKLFGASLNCQPEQLVREIIQRNYDGLDKAEGWYLIRNLSVATRNAWQYGDRWYGDGISAVRRQINMPYYTPTARKLSLAMKSLFTSIPSDVYGNIYDQMQERLRLWETSPDPDKKIWLVGKEQRAQEITSASSLTEQVDLAYKRKLPLLSKKLTRQSEPRGWHLRLETSDTIAIIDPSIARFPSKAIFLSSIKQALK